MRALLCLTLLSYVLESVGTGAAHAQQAASSWKDRFLQEAPRRWQEYHERGKRLQGSWTDISIDRAEAGKVYGRRRLEFKQNATCALTIDQALLGKTQVGTLNAVNPRYGFQLRRMAPDKPWAIIGQRVGLQDGYDLGTPPDKAIRNWVGFPFCIGGTATTRLPDVIEDTDFSVQSAVPTARGGRTLVRIEFTDRPKDWKPRGESSSDWLPLRGGWILFDPERYWVIHECNVQWQFTPASGSSVLSMEGKFEYKEGQEGFPILTRIIRRFEGLARGKPVQHENTQEFHLTEQEALPESEFTLSAFGLPEPFGVELVQSGPRWWLWAGIGGVLCLTLGAVVRRLKLWAGRTAPVSSRSPL